jgi:Cu(I)/Ag(I) efflux system membrane fusion protein/cobalt-zinc-cadmium efflux system membrane fusion protein
MNLRTTLRPVVLVLLALAAGWWVRGLWTDATPAGAPAGSKPVSGEGPCAGGAEPEYWQAPMDPTFIRDEPGKSPMGMDLVPVCPDEGSGGTDTGQVRVDPATLQSIGVRTAPVEIRDLHRRVRAVGRVTWDERRVAHVHTKVQGWVEKLYVDYLGQEVRRGQPLLEIYSPELVATQEELLLAARYRDATGESAFGDVVAGGESLYRATRRRLELWDISDREIDRLLESGEVKRTLTLNAPTSGVVTSLEVRSGMEVAPNDNLYTIADLSTVWVVSNAYEYELPWIRLGQTASFELSYLPGRRFTAPVTYVSPFLDPETRTARVRIEVPNSDGQLKPEMFGNTIIEAEPREDAIAIPSQAVIRSGRRTLAIVALGDGRFAPRDVVLGLETDDGWSQVLDGLSRGDRVVVSSQFLIDSESKLQEAIRSLLSEREGERPPASDEGSGTGDEMGHGAMDHRAMDHGDAAREEQ